ncbi:MAG: hypothetical protein JOZ19_03990 [Rubrobacter sp.]|nr:hypothetical protein [Rubrobacter sp.]
MEDPRVKLALPEEPIQLRAATRALIEDSPKEGIRLVNAGFPMADFLWKEWGAQLEGMGMDRAKFLHVTRGYAGEIRLWVMGERPWEHCISGLSGRILRRLPRQNWEQEEPTLAGCAEAHR